MRMRAEPCADNARAALVFSRDGTCICSVERARGGGARDVKRRYPAAGRPIPRSETAKGGEDHASCRVPVHGFGDGRNRIAARSAADDSRCAGHARAASAAAGLGLASTRAEKRDRASAALPSLPRQGAAGARPELSPVLPSAERITSSHRHAAPCHGSPRDDASQEPIASPEGEPPCRSAILLEEDNPAMPRHDLQTDHAAQELPDDDEAGSPDDRQTSREAPRLVTSPDFRAQGALPPPLISATLAIELQHVGRRAPHLQQLAGQGQMLAVRRHGRRPCDRDLAVEL